MSSPTVRGIEIQDLVKHASLFAMSGVGKTSLVMHMLVQLYANAIPFLVLEPAKREYRVLKGMTQAQDATVCQLARQLHLYTPGQEQLAPIQCDPLSLLPGDNVAHKIEQITEMLILTADYFDPLPFILRQSLSELYYDYLHRDGPPPRMADILRYSLTYLQRCPYDAEVRGNLSGALQTRLSGFDDGSSTIGKMYRCGQNNPTNEQLASGYSLCELAGLSDRELALTALSLVQRIREYLARTPWQDRSQPRLVMVFEEAHRLFPALGTEMNTALVEVICNLLQEIRALGGSVVFVDQSPSALPAAVLKATGSKIVGRQVELNDRQLLAASMLLTEAQTTELARLQTGEFYLFCEGYRRAVKIKTENTKKALGFPHESEVMGDRILHCICQDDWYLSQRRQRVHAELTLLSRECDRLQEFARDMFTAAARLLTQPPVSAEAVRRFTVRVERYLRSFHKDIFVPLTNQGALESPDREYRESLRVRFATTRQNLEDTISRLQKHHTTLTKGRII